jgi:putative flippase GtrA
VEAGFPIVALNRDRSDRLTQFARFCVVGTSGYLVNLSIYSALVMAGLHYRVSACVSFALSVSSNYVLHRVWTFRGRGAPIVRQSLRFVTVSLVALAVNELWLGGFVALGIQKIPAQAFACILVIPVSFLGNRLWAFARPATA